MISFLSFGMHHYGEINSIPLYVLAIYSSRHKHHKIAPGYYKYSENISIEYG